MHNIRILSPFPPPFGGVALHCVRLLEALRNRGITAIGISLGGLPNGLVDISTFSLKSLVSRMPVHYHSDEGNHRWMRIFALIWRAIGTPYIITVHSFRGRAEFSSTVVVSQLKRAYNGARAIIAISDEVADAISNTLGIHRERITVISSNLPLSSWEQQPVDVPTALHLWCSFPIRIIANAGRIVRFNGQDLYGLDVLIKAFASLGDSDIALCLVIGQVVDRTLMDELAESIALDTRITILHGLGSPLAPLVNMSHIVVRPTRTEGGSSLTVSEAMELGKWAIGSDAVQRPDGCLTFTNEDDAELAICLRQTIDNVRNGEMPVARHPFDGVLASIINVYVRSGFINTTHTPADV